MYQHIYCRYIAPGECIFFADYGAEFTSNLQRKLAKDFGVEMRCFSAGRPWGNGQAEAALKKIKKIFIKNSMFCH